MGFVICPPLGWESIQCYESLRLLGTELAEAGFHTLRVHYDGTGESPGSDEDPDRLPAWIASIRAAVSALESEAGVEGVVLIGLRFGGTLAALVSEETKLAGLVLWEACAKGALYLRELEILAAGSVPPGGPAGVDAEDEGALVATGYRLSAQTVQAVRTIDFDRIAPTGQPPVMLVARDDRPAPTRVADHFAGLGCPTTLEALPGHKEMMIYPERSRPPRVIIDRILEWAALRSVGPGGVASFTSSVVAPDVVHDGVRHRAVSFGEGGRLFGVLSVPYPPVVPTPAALLTLTGGVVPRTAVNGMYKAAADRLARRGHTVLRIDISGIGESAAMPGRGRGDVYAPETLVDVEAALEILRSEAPDVPIHVLGLCSGAYWAFRAATAGADLAGLILINPLVLGAWGDPAQAEETLTNVQTRAAVSDSSRWMKLMRGEVDALGRIQDLMRGLLHKVGRLGARIGWALGRFPAGVPTSLQQLLGRGVAVQVLFSGQDRGRSVLAGKLGRAADRLADAGLGTTLFEGADHTFNGFSSRRRLLDWLEEYLSGS